MKLPKFGDRMHCIYASKDNPLKYGIFVRLRKHSYEITDGKGKFWLCPPESCEIIKDEPVKT